MNAQRTCDLGTSQSVDLCEFRVFHRDRYDKIFIANVLQSVRHGWEKKRVKLYIERIMLTQKFIICRVTWCGTTSRAKFAD